MYLYIPITIYAIIVDIHAAYNPMYLIKHMLIAILIIGVGCVLPPYNSWSRLIKLWNRVAVVDSFGVYTYQFDDLFQSLKPTLNNMFGYDNALKTVSDYYNGRNKEQSINEWTGIFENKNVIAQNETEGSNHENSLKMEEIQ